VIWLMTGSLSEAQFKEKGIPAVPRRGIRPAPAQAAVNALNTFWCAMFSPILPMARHWLWRFTMAK
jgi:hypothetical protein